MTSAPGWYPDPHHTGGLRYFDGTAWTANVAPQPVTRASPWKGARLGRPQYGPGSLASPARRLAARLLDSLILSPVVIVAIVLVLTGFLHAVSNFGQDPSNQGSADVAGIIGFELAVFGVVVLFGVVAFLYEALTTLRFGRSPGKAIMRIRPLRLDGSLLSASRAFGRAGSVYVAAFVQLLQLLDVLWCLWDEDVQCLHDKVCETIVVSDD